MGAVALAIVVWVLNRQKPSTAGRRSVIVALLLLPMGIALALGKWSVAIVSTVVRQFALAGLGEEFAFRGYFQPRLNQAFGRPLCACGIQFGAGLIVASLLFGLWHVDNTFDPAIGWASLSWGRAMRSAVAGLLFGVIRDKTGTLVAPGVAHGLEGAVGQALSKVPGSM
jgi:membrane protease YdiL (CAAX protease family)